METDNIVIGLDLSLTNTGLVILKNDKIIKQISIKSKPIGENLPTDELIRITIIIDKIKEELIPFKENIDIVIIEGLAFLAHNTSALTQISGMNYMVRDFIHKWYDNGDIKNDFVIVAPTQLKKFATGKGNCHKDIVMKEIYKKYKIDFNDNNIADAFILAKIGNYLLGENKKEMIKTEKEVIEMLCKQLN